MADGASFSKSITSIPFRFEELELDRPSHDDLASCPEYHELLENVASCSPFLRGLIETDSDWVVRLAGTDPGIALEEILTDLDVMPPTEAARVLRLRKRRLSLLTALADLGGIWHLGEVTGALTRFADFSSDAMLHALVRDSVRRGKLDRYATGEDSGAQGLFALAMGKMGAFELNYSSDIDLIVLFDESLHDGDVVQSVKSEFIRVTRKFMKFMGSASDGGYVFRTDLRLRPDPFVNPVCMSAGGAARYYESFARTWERAAFIKARPCAGDKPAAERFLQEIHPFIWRTLLDFTAVKDTADIKFRISDNKGTGDLSDLFGHDIKLGHGGIRQIELFVQTFQMIAGGRDRSLRIPDTLGAMKALTEAGWVNETARTRLSECYHVLRNTEHRLQMVQDSQTHSLPRNVYEFDRLAAMSCYRDTDRLVADLREVMADVDYHTASAYESDSDRNQKTGEPDFLTDQDREMITQWETLPALRTDRAVDLFNTLKPLILSRMSLARNPHEAMSHFDRFLRGLPAGVQLFSLFEANPKLVELLADTCTTAPRLALHLGKTAHVFDEVLYESFFQEFEDTGTLCEQLNDELDDATDYENELRVARRWLNSKNFRLGTHHLKHMIDFREVSDIYSRLADAVLTCLWPKVVNEFSRRYGPPPGRGATVMAMGSLGARSMTATSDLDLIVIYDPLDQEESSGPKSLPSRLYFARLTQAFVSAITSPIGEGILYDIDMRLRPSGRKGPVATSYESFTNYQKHDAWTWEHLALTRARPVCGSGEIGQELEAFRQNLLMEKRDVPSVLADVRDMRAKLADNLSPETDADIWELKKGRGRMLDIELLAQTSALITGSTSRMVGEQLSHASGQGWISDNDNADLNSGYDTLGCVLQAVRLTVDGRFAVETAGDGVRDFLLQATGQNAIGSLKDKLQSERQRMADIIDRQLA